MKKSAKNKYSLQLLSNNVKCILRNRLSNEYCKTRKNKNNQLIVPFFSQRTVALRRGKPASLAKTANDLLTFKTKLAKLNSVKKRNYLYCRRNRVDKERKSTGNSSTDFVRDWSKKTSPFLLAKHTERRSLLSPKLSERNA